MFRYKMPRLQAKTEGRGNGIKTVIMNMAEIATAINRPAVSVFEAQLPTSRCNQRECLTQADPLTLDIMNRRIFMRHALMRTCLTCCLTFAYSFLVQSLPTKFFGTELGAQSRWEEDVS